MVASSTDSFQGSFVFALEEKVEAPYFDDINNSFSSRRDDDDLHNNNDANNNDYDVDNDDAHGDLEHANSKKGGGDNDASPDCAETKRIRTLHHVSLALLLLNFLFVIASFIVLSLFDGSRWLLAVYLTFECLFFFSLLALQVYHEQLVQCRHDTVNRLHREANDIVSSLFPANVRERLFQSNAPSSTATGSTKKQRRISAMLKGNNNNNNTNNIPNDLVSMSDASFGEMSETTGDSIFGPKLTSSKNRLKNFLKEGRLLPSNNSNNHHHHATQQTDASSTSSLGDDLQHHHNDTTMNGAASVATYGTGTTGGGAIAKPIADLFPQTTVLFADIAGFTAWSSQREPEQVFTLLQTIYHAFDLLARKRAVFKVETIGDCYVAVCGLPDPQPDHAVRMVKFARECMTKMMEMTKKLERTLGPETGELCLRIGLHSGPCIAGVLLGEKSRFQLFGDTVNMASRMESTGEARKIQISQTTADLVTEGGKEYWIRPRDELVQAKGKGKVQTFWVVPRSSSTACNGMMSRSLHSEETSSDYKSGGPLMWGDAQGLIKAQPGADGANTKSERLIDWQVELLAGALKHIVEFRKARDLICGVIGSPDDKIEPITTQSLVLDEVTESITLPKLDAEDLMRIRETHISVELDTVVMDQLREYVTQIASFYRSNAFHNFEHANHVTQSVNKLLKRVKEQDNVDNNFDLHHYTHGITSDPVTQFAIIFSALIHDVDHEGVPNAQLIKEKPHIGVLYQNRSVAEQNSVELAWELLMESKYEALQRCIYSTETELRQFRQVVVNIVMATDIFDPDMKALRNQRWEKAFHNESALLLSPEDVTDLKATIVLEHLMQASDVSHTMQHWHIYTKWNERLFREMYASYESGRSDKDPSLGWYKGELWFFDNYIIPLAKKLSECRVFGVSSDEYLNYALENRKEWEAKGERIIDSFLSKYASHKVQQVQEKEHQEQKVQKNIQQQLLAGLEDNWDDN